MKLVSDGASIEFEGGTFEIETSESDFPLRGKAVYLFVKRRRWLNTNTGKLVTRNWEMVAEGTRMTKEFASFLKVISGLCSS